MTYFIAFSNFLFNWSSLEVLTPEEQRKKDFKKDLAQQEA